jgi:UDPglucose 6-dehydrogenase
VREPGLAELLARQLETGSLRALNADDPELGTADVVVLALDVDVDDRDEPSLDRVEATAARVGELLTAPVPLVVMSQVPAGSCDRLARLAGERFGEPLPVACVPENLRLGSALDGFFRPDRVVVGADDERVRAAVEDLFAGVEAPFLSMGIRSAEMSKHALNAYLATCISFSSEIADLCERVGADARDVVRALRADRRVSDRAPLLPGLGFAGGTLGRDLRSLAGLGAASGTPTPLVEAVGEVNRRRIAMVADRVEQGIRGEGGPGAPGGGLDGAVVALLGLTYKPGTDTLRRSQSLEVAAQLLDRGAVVRGHDPMLGPERLGEVGFPLSADPYEAASGADAAVLMTPWPQYRELDLARLAGAMRRPFVFDPAAFLDEAAAGQAGIRREIVGTGPGRPQEADVPAGSIGLHAGEPTVVLGLDGGEPAKAAGRCGGSPGAVGAG